MPISVKSDKGSHQIDKYPDICPLCHHAIKPVHVSTTLADYQELGLAHLDAAFKCTRATCKRMFIGQYSSHIDPRGVIGSFVFIRAMPQNYIEPELFEEVVEISPDFKEIYCQAAAAEADGLDQISGVGYRKALEFLIKDYCVSRHKDKENDIRKAFLSPVIKNYVTDPNVKACAELATWLGNDETHYVRKWVDKDISDLKTLIDLTCGWIRNAVLTAKYLEEMKGEKKEGAA